MDGTPCRITVSRRHAADVRDRQIIVSVDGELFATLLFGEEVTRQIEPGAHRLRAHNPLFWKTRDVALEPGEHARYTVVNRAGLGTYSVLGLLGDRPALPHVRACRRRGAVTRRHPRTMGPGPGWQHWQTG